jgi:hypothetical protein
MFVRLLDKASRAPVDAFALTPALSPYRGEGGVGLRGKITLSRLAGEGRGEGNLGRRSTNPML